MTARDLMVNEVRAPRSVGELAATTVSAETVIATTVPEWLNRIVSFRADNEFFILFATATGTVSTTTGWRVPGNVREDWYIPSDLTHVQVITAVGIATIKYCVTSPGMGR